MGRLCKKNYFYTEKKEDTRFIRPTLEWFSESCKQIFIVIILPHIVGSRLLWSRFGILDHLHNSIQIRHKILETRPSLAHEKNQCHHLLVTISHCSPTPYNTHSAIAIDLFFYQVSGCVRINDQRSTDLYYLSWKNY
jgi:hypothetical protein